jgi:outer membrane murein-binding lipoprotein Lpp
MSAGAARGPLSSVLAQWTVIGVGGLNLVGNDSFTENVMKGAQVVMGLPITGSFLTKEAPVAAAAQAPIVIHTGGGSSSSSSETTNAKLVASLVQVCIGASICWGSYLVMSNFLPDSVKEMLPVTRKFFDKAVTSLAKGIFEVKEQLSDQIKTLMGKQDQLQEKQDATHDEVLGVKDDVGDLKLDLENMHHTLGRCESSLTEAERKQTYTARGVRLLVKCVGAILPRNADLTTELESFSKLGDDIHDNDSSGAVDPQQQQMQYHQQQQQQQMMMMQSPQGQHMMMQSPPPISSQHQMMSPQYSQHSSSSLNAGPPQQYTPIVTATAAPPSVTSSVSTTTNTTTSPPTTTKKKEFDGPENETPQSAGLEDVRALLTMVRGGEVTVQTVQ